jgi:hypothetical protein
MDETDTHGMTAVAVETVHELPRLRVLEPPPTHQIAPWELHSELVLVSEELRSYALEQLPERDPYAFLERPIPSIAVSAAPTEAEPPAASVPGSVAGYVLWRLLQTTRSALLFAAALVGLASAAELLR